jgi:hypothetical protein
MKDAGHGKGFHLHGVSIGGQMRTSHVGTVRNFPRWRVSPAGSGI